MSPFSFFQYTHLSHHSMHIHVDVEGKNFYVLTCVNVTSYNTRHSLNPFDKTPSKKTLVALLCVVYLRKKNIEIWVEKNLFKECELKEREAKNFLSTNEWNKKISEIFINHKHTALIVVIHKLCDFFKNKKFLEKFCLNWFKDSICLYK